MRTSAGRRCGGEPAVSDEQGNRPTLSPEEKERLRQEALAKARARQAAKEAGGEAAGAAGDGSPAPAAAPELPADQREVLEALRAQFSDIEFAPEANAGDGYLYLQVPANRLPEVARFLRDRLELNYLRCLSGVDKGVDDGLRCVYHLVRLRPEQAADRKVALLVDTSRDDPEIPSVVDVWPTADFQEREIFDLFGVRFAGHPNLVRILLPDNWQGGYPLRKDFVDKRPKKPRKIRPR